MIKIVKFLLVDRTGIQNFDHRIRKTEALKFTTDQLALDKSKWLDTADTENPCKFEHASNILDHPFNL